MRWKHTLDISDVFDADIPFTQIRDTIVERIRNDEFIKPYLTTYVGIIVERISEAEDADIFDEHWNLFYNWCDMNKVWVKTF